MSNQPILEEFYPDLVDYENQQVFEGMETDLEYERRAIASIARIIEGTELYTEEEWLAMAAFRNAELYPQLELPLEDGAEVEIDLAA